MTKIFKILRYILILLTTVIFSLMISLIAISKENIFLIVITISFSFVLTATTIIDVFKKRRFSKIYSIITTVSMTVILLTMIRPILDTLYIDGLSLDNFDYILNNCLIYFVENLFTYIIIYILIFIGNYINFKIEK